MGSFKKGLILGSAVGAFLTWLNVTPKGKEMRGKIVQHLEPLYGELKMSIQQLEGPTREMWEALVERAVEEYGDKKELAEDVKNNLTRQLKKRWTDLKKEMKKN